MPLRGCAMMRGSSSLPRTGENRRRQSRMQVRTPTNRYRSSSVLRKYRQPCGPEAIDPNAYTKLDLLGHCAATDILTQPPSAPCLEGVSMDFITHGALIYANLCKFCTTCFFVEQHIANEI